MILLRFNPWSLTISIFSSCFKSFPQISPSLLFHLIQFTFLFLNFFIMSLLFSSITLHCKWKSVNFLGQKFNYYRKIETGSRDSSASRREVAVKVEEPQSKFKGLQRLTYEISQPSYYRKYWNILIKLLLLRNIQTFYIFSLKLRCQLPPKSSSLVVSSSPVHSVWSVRYFKFEFLYMHVLKHQLEVRFWT